MPAAVVVFVFVLDLDSDDGSPWSRTRVDHAGSGEPFWYGPDVREFSADAIVVLGARIDPDGLPGPAARRRVERAAQVFARGVAPVILTTGGRRWHGHVEAVSMQRLLTRLGVPEQAIVLEPFALSTAENAFFSARIARLRRWNRLAVVTCPWHMQRAIADFEQCGQSVIPAPAVLAPATPTRRIYRSAKEWTCIWLDALRLRARFPW